VVDRAIRKRRNLEKVGLNSNFSVKEGLAEVAISKFSYRYPKPRKKVTVAGGGRAEDD